MKFQNVRSLIFLRLFLFTSIFFNERHAFLVCVGTYLLILTLLMEISTKIPKDLKGRLHYFNE